MRLGQLLDIVMSKFLGNSFHDLGDSVLNSGLFKFINQLIKNQFSTNYPQLIKNQYDKVVVYYLLSFSL